MRNMPFTKLDALQAINTVRNATTDITTQQELGKLIALIDRLPDATFEQMIANVDKARWGMPAAAVVGHLKDTLEADPIASAGLYAMLTCTVVSLA